MQIKHEWRRNRDSEAAPQGHQVDSATLAPAARREPRRPHPRSCPRRRCWAGAQGLQRPETPWVPRASAAPVEGAEFNGRGQGSSPGRSSSRVGREARRLGGGRGARTREERGDGGGGLSVPQTYCFVSFSLVVNTAVAFVRSKTFQRGEERMGTETDGQGREGGSLGGGERPRAGANTHGGAIRTPESARGRGAQAPPPPPRPHPPICYGCAPECGPDRRPPPLMSAQGWSWGCPSGGPGLGRCWVGGKRQEEGASQAMGLQPPAGRGAPGGLGGPGGARPSGERGGGRRQGGPGAMAYIGVGAALCSSLGGLRGGSAGGRGGAPRGRCPARGYFLSMSCSGPGRYLMTVSRMLSSSSSTSSPQPGGMAFLGRVRLPSELASMAACASASRSSFFLMPYCEGGGGQGGGPGGS